MKELTRRLLVPLAIPLGTIVFVGILVFSFSRVLLAVPEAWSVLLAIIFAAEIVAVAAAIAAGTRLRGPQRVILTALALGVVAGGAGAAAQGIREIHKHAQEITIAAKDLKFSTDALVFPAEQAVTIKFTNNDTAPHNVAVYRTEAATEPIVVGQVFQGPGTLSYSVPAQPPGSYFFRCDVHPDMKGTVTVGEGDGEPPPSPSPVPTGPQTTPTGPPPGPPGPTADAIEARNIEFNKTELILAAGKDVELTLDNQDSAPHNVGIYLSEEAAASSSLGSCNEGCLFQGELVDPGRQQTYRLKLPAGQYFFRCDLHPNMKGTAIFR